MKLLALLAAIVLCILAAILGWNFAPHHSFSLVAISIGCIALALVPLPSGFPTL